MKTLLTLGLIAVGYAGCSNPRPSPAKASLLLPLRPYVNEVANELAKISADRKAVLAEIAATIAARLETGADAKLTFICTHNSRRSHMSQIWAQTAAYYYGLNQVYAFSGGTEVTACNCRTVTAMRRVGFEIQDATTGDNPLYLVRYADDRPPIPAYSKLYNADPRLCDDTPTETAAYSERCREIAREMFYILSEVRRQTDRAARR